MNRRVSSVNTLRTMMEELRREEEQRESNFCNKLGERLKNVVYGGLDGLMTTFACLASAVGGNLSVRDATLMALANVLVEGFSMGMGDFISDYGDSCMMKKLREEEMQDFDKKSEKKILKLQTLYIRKGVTEDKAILLARTIYGCGSEIYADHVLNLTLDACSSAAIDQIFYNGVTTFLSFISAGLIPFLSYLVCAHIFHLEKDKLMKMLISVSLVAFFTLGGVQGVVSGRSFLTNGSYTAAYGVIAIFMAYFIGVKMGN